MRRRMLLAACVAVLSMSLVPSHAVVGGGSASAGEYPWMAAIYTDLGGQYCGGSLIAPTFVVTAAHCVDELLDNTFGSLPVDLLKVKVLLGSIVLNGTGERIPVKALHVHPNPDIDAAILELDRPSNQTPIEWVQPGQENLYAAGVIATITGWGRTSEGGAGSNTLKEAQVPIVSDAQCETNYNGGIEPAYEVCAGYPQGGTDTCQGDSGGPLMVPKPGGGLILVGATSWGEGCARPNRPGVYAEIAAAAAFIDQYA